jgi:hypothetical protein
MADRISSVAFKELAGADLVLDAVYTAGSTGTVADDPLSRLLPGVGNQGGFRPRGSSAKQTVCFAALYTTGNEPDWPDELDAQTGLFTYYGDNKNSGRELHDTPRGGNLLLRDTFALSHGGAEDRRRVPPFFLFERNTNVGRDIRFRGLLAPGGPGLTPDDELQAIWRTTRGMRFQNYRARFTVLDVAKISRRWITELAAGEVLGRSSPKVWRNWVEARTYYPLTAPTTRVVRGRDEQLPRDATRRQIIRAIYSHFQKRPHDFESCAVAIWRMMAPATGACDVTRPSRDGGRDAVGEYLLGPAADRLAVEFALEAKCYAAERAVGVRDVARLISRIRHRQFGVFVTTSYFNRQVYEEVRTDQHPIVLICGLDMADVLRRHGYTDARAVQTWLDQAFQPAS